MQTNPSHIISFGKKIENLQKAIESKTIGTKRNSFGRYITSESIIYLHGQSKIWARCKVEGQPFYSEEPIWDDSSYPYRLRIANIEVLKTPFSMLDGSINIELQKLSGKGWQYKHLFVPKPIPPSVSRLIQLAFVNAQKN